MPTKEHVNYIRKQYTSQCTLQGESDSAPSGRYFWWWFVSWNKQEGLGTKTGNTPAFHVHNWLRWQMCRPCVRWTVPNIGRRGSIFLYCCISMAVRNLKNFLWSTFNQVRVPRCSSTLLSGVLCSPSTRIVVRVRVLGNSRTSKTTVLKKIARKYCFFVMPKLGPL